MKQVRKPLRQTKDLEFSKELQGVFDYVVDILAVEFPIELITPEYIILSMLDRETHALVVFQNYLSKKEIDKIRDTYASVIDSHSNKSEISAFVANNKEKELTFNDDASRLLERAKDEANLCFANDISTEHVLLALLNPMNSFNDSKIFNELNLDYKEILLRCKHEQLQEPYNDADAMLQGAIKIPSKSAVGMVGISSTSEYIERYTVDMNDSCSKGKLDKLIGRTKELDKIVTVLARRKKNNCVVVGEGGCGKTTLVYGLIQRIVNKEVPAFLIDKKVIKLDVMALVSGTTLRGMLEERISGICNELRNTNKYILFIDDIQQLLGESGSSDNDSNLTNMLNEILDIDGVRVIGTTNFKTYKKHIEPNPSISRKFHRVVLDAPSIDEAIDIIENSKEYYESHHNVSYPKSIIERCVTLAKRYITNRLLPDSAFDIIDTIGAKTHVIDSEPNEITKLQQELNAIEKRKQDEVNKGNFEFLDEIKSEENGARVALAEAKRSFKKNKKKEITIDMVNECISDITGIPIKNINTSDRAKIKEIDSILKGCVIGQNDAVDEVSRVMKRNSIGLGDKNRVLGSFLFYGSTGVGKTLLAKELAKQVFGSETNLIRIDMSEYSEKASMSKLIGTTAGYIGYDKGGGILTEAVKNHPYSVILFDEIEKANPEIYNLFLQLFDEGRLTDGSGVLVNFKNTIVIMTSNVGVKKANEMGAGIGFNTNAEANHKSIVEKTIKQTFTPEFLNRIDKLVYFNNLSDDNLKQIIKIEFTKFNKRLSEIGHTMSITDPLIDYIFKKIDKKQNFGARPICRLIQRELEDKITNLLLDNEYGDVCHTFIPRIDGEELIIE